MLLLEVMFLKTKQKTNQTFLSTEMPRVTEKENSHLPLKTIAKND